MCARDRGTGKKVGKISYLCRQNFKKLDNFLKKFLKIFKTVA